MVTDYNLVGQQLYSHLIGPFPTRAEVGWPTVFLYTGYPSSLSNETALDLYR